MTEYGVVHNVRVTTLGSYLAADAALAATTLTVESAVDFNEHGGHLSIAGVTYVYLSANLETDQVTLQTGLSVAATEKTRVDVLPATIEKRATVVLAGSEESIVARVPHTLMDRMPDGIREEGAREGVSLVLQSGEFVVLEVLGREPVIDGSYIDPATVPEPPSDGLPPSTSPTPTVVGGIGAVFIRWTPIGNHDPVTYKVYVSTTAGFTPGPGNLVVETAGSSFTYRPAVPDYAATYYAKVVASDEDGDAPASTEASAQLMQVTNPDVAGNFGYFGQIAVGQLIGGLLGADIVLGSKISSRGGGLGAGVDIDPTGIYIFDSSGTPATMLQPDRSTFKGAAELTGLTATAAAFRGTANEIAKGAALTLQTGTTAPQSAPSAVPGWETTPAAILWGDYGLVWADSQWNAVWASSPPQIDRTVDVSSPIILGDANSPVPWGGLTRVGTSWYTLGWRNVGAVYTWYITKYSSTGVQQAQITYGPIAGAFGSGGSVTLGLAPAAIGTDGTDILVGEFDAATDRYRIASYNATTLAFGGTVNTSGQLGFSGPVVGIRRGTFDFGSTRTVILARNAPHYYTFDGALAYQPNDTWTTPVTGSMSGFDWDGTRFWGTDARNTGSDTKLSKHTTHKWTGFDPATWHTVGTWRDTDATGGTHETDMSPAASFSMWKRARVTLTSTTIPDTGGVDDPNAVSFYLSNTTTARTAMWRQTLPADGVNTITVGDGITFTGTNPPAANNFPGATPGQIKSPSGGLLISGDGTIESDAITENTRRVATGMKGGAFTGTTNASGHLVVTHGLPATPTWAIACVHSTNTFFCAVVTLAASTVTFVVNHRDASGGVLVSTAVTVSWIAGY